MNLLRAHVREYNGWWEVRLLDLDIMADGASEDEVLRQLEHSLTVEYHLARKAGQEPFVRLLLSPPGAPADPAGEETGAGKVRPLRIPAEVGAALAAAIRAREDRFGIKVA